MSNKRKIGFSFSHFPTIILAEMRRIPGGEHSLVLIVGRGLHSEGGIARIKPAMIDMANK